MKGTPVPGRILETTEQRLEIDRLLQEVEEGRRQGRYDCAAAYMLLRHKLQV